MTLSNKNQNDKLNFELAYSYNVEYNFSNTPLNRFNKSVTNHERLDLLKKLENKISSIKDCKLKSNSSKIVFSDENFAGLHFTGSSQVFKNIWNFTIINIIIYFKIF